MAYKSGVDPSNECGKDNFARVENNIDFTDNPACLDQEKIVIVTVPTPVDNANVPDLGPLRAACETIGRSLFKGDLVIDILPSVASYVKILVAKN